MTKRNKSRFEKWFSLSRHRRRRGATVQSDKISTDFFEQRDLLISEEEGEKRYTHGSYHDLEKQLDVLKFEFIGESTLCWTHAKIIVLIRREFQIEKHYQLFKELWEQEGDFLLKNLNTRWLISAADTFADHSKDNAEQALSVACSCLINTIKIQETERYIIGAEKNNDIPDRVFELQNGRVALFDGTSAFAIGTDDTLRNMRWRIDKVSKSSIVGKILLELFLRVQENRTVYQRTRERHNRNKTAWW